MRILIIRFSSLGDITMATALPRVIRKKFPDAIIDMTVRADFRDLIEWNNYIDNKIYLNKKDGIKGLIQLYKKIKNKKYDLIIDAHRSIRSQLLCTLMPFTPKVFFNKRTFKRLLLIHFKINLFKNIDFNIIEYIKPLKKYGIEYDGKGTEIIIPEETINKVSDIIKPHKALTGSNIIIGIIPSAQWSGKRWSVDNFKELVSLIYSNINVTVIIIGGPNDDFCNKIAEVSPNAISFSGLFSKLESSAALSLCDVVIANDTGMMHVAEAVGTDVIGLMGPTSKEFGCYPYRKNSIVIEKKLWCRPCSKNGSGHCIRFGKRPCLNNIKPLEVFETLKLYLIKAGILK